MQQRPEEQPQKAMVHLVHVPTTSRIFILPNCSAFQECRPMCAISSYILRPRWTGDKPHMPLLWHKTAQQQSCFPDSLRIQISVTGEIWLLWPHYKAAPTSTEWVVRRLGLGAGEALTGHPCSLGVDLRTADRLEGTVVGNSHSSLSS